MVQNIGHRQHRLSEPWNLTIRSGETVDVPFDAAMTLSKNPEFTILWDDGDYKHSDKPGKLTHLTYLSPFASTDGYGVIGCNTLKNFAKYGITAYTPHPVRSNVRSGLSINYPEVLELLDRKIAYPTKVGLCHTIPPDITEMRTPIRLLHTMFEATTITTDWRRYVEMADALIVPSKGQIPIFRDSGYKRNIFVVPDGLEVDTFAYQDRPERDVFTFFTWGRLSSRKAPWELLRAWVSAFVGVKDVRLIFKTHDNMFGGGCILSPDSITIKDDRVKIINEEWTRQQLTDALYNADAAVFASRGEGFHCPGPQAALTGLPVVVTRHSGIEEWADPRYFYNSGLNKNEPLVPSPFGKHDGHDLMWWNPDWDELAAQMRYVYDHRAEAKEKGKKASAYIRRNFSVDAMMRNLVKVLDRFA